MDNAGNVPDILFTETKCTVKSYKCPLLIQAKSNKFVEEFDRNKKGNRTD